MNQLQTSAFLRRLATLVDQSKISVGAIHEALAGAEIEVAGTYHCFRNGMIETSGGGLKDFNAEQVTSLRKPKPVKAEPVKAEPVKPVATPPRVLNPLSKPIENKPKP